jgi:hypothetical protein
MKIKPTYYWFAIFALTFIAYQLVQDSIRPNYDGDNLIIKYLLGVAPNFFPSIGIPALFVIIIPELNYKNNSSEWLNKKKHLTAIGISLIGLLSWEFMQIKTTKARFDWNDVLWTFIGALIFYFLWTLTQAKYKGK